MNTELKNWLISNRFGSKIEYLEKYNINTFDKLFLAKKFMEKDGIGKIVIKIFDEAISILPNTVYYYLKSPEVLEIVMNLIK